MNLRKFVIGSFVRLLAPKRGDGDRPFGFTLVEILAVVVLIGIVAGIAIPSWLKFLTTRRINRAQRDTLNIMRDAQAKAQKEKRDWSACFRDENGQVEWTLLAGDQRRAAGNCDGGNLGWQPLGKSDADKVEIDTSESTLALNGSGDYTIAFNFRGQVDPPFGRVTFQPRRNNSPARRCVVVSTLLGVLRLDEDGDC